MYHVLFQRPHLQSSAERRDQCQTVAYLYHLQRMVERTNAQRTGRFERRETVPQTEAKLTAIRHTGRGLLLSQGRPPVIPFRRVCHRYRPSPLAGGNPPLARHLVRR